MIKYFQDMTDEEMAALLKEEDELDKSYSEGMKVELTEEAREAEDLETEADLYRYWKP